LKQIEAVIRPQRLSALVEAVDTLGYRGLTVRSVTGQGIQGGVAQQWRREEYRVDLLPKVSVMMVVQDSDAEDLIDVIVKATRTDRIGGGKIFVTPIDEVIRVRTGETGSCAL
jgi:nitrogen regulatory protein P-II 1